MKLNIVSLASAVIVACFGCSSDDYTIQSRSYASVDTGDVTDITENGSTLHGEFLQPGNSAITDYGFIYNQDHDNIRMNDAERVSLGTTVQTKFSAVADHGLDDGRLCWYRAYAVVGNNLIVYGVEKSFTAKGGLPPVINTLVPASGKQGDQVIIQGVNFSDEPYKTQVIFGGVSAHVVSTTATSITCTVPFLPTGNIDVVVKLGTEGTPSAPKTFAVTN